MEKDLLISGIICEFNPLHNGHRHILGQMHKNGLVVCVMSGNFVQRGEPAILDKWTRTQLALENGADLVLELPLPFATANAETFAMGGIGILNALHCTDELWCGSECGNMTSLKRISNLLLSPTYDALVKEKLSAGSHFAAAREAAIGELLGNNYGGELSGSNNILAVEYLKALTRLSSDITFKTISRIGGAHDDIAPGEFVSAMQIRKQLHMGTLPFGTVPSSTLREIAKHEEEGHCPASFQPIERAVLAKLRTMSAAEFATLPDISEGLENKLLKAVKTADSLKTLYATMKSKRYSHARMRRLVLHAFLGISADSQKLHYIKILGMTQRGEGIIKRAKPDLPLIGKSTEIYKLSKTAQKCFAAEAQADDLYGLTTPQILPCGLTYTKKIIKA